MDRILNFSPAEPEQKHQQNFRKFDAHCAEKMVKLSGIISIST